MKFMKKTCLIGIALLVIGLVGIIPGILHRSYDPTAAVTEHRFRIHHQGSFDRIRVDSKVPVSISMGKHLRVTGKTWVHHVHVRVRHHQLQILDNSWLNHLSNFQIGPASYNAGQIKVEVPRRDKIKQLRADSGLILNNMKIKKINWRDSDDDFDLNRVQTDRLTANGKNGDMKIAHCRLGLSWLRDTNGDVSLIHDHWQKLNGYDDDGDFDVVDPIFQQPSLLSTHNGDLTVHGLSQSIRVRGHSQSGDFNNYHESQRRAVPFKLISDDGDVNVH